MSEIMIMGALILALLTYLFLIYPFIASYRVYRESIQYRFRDCVATFVNYSILSFIGISITMMVISCQSKYLFQNEPYAIFWEISILMMSGAASLAVFKKNRYAGILCFPVLYIVVYFASMLIMRGVRYYAGG